MISEGKGCDHSPVARHRRRGCCGLAPWVAFLCGAALLTSCVVGPDYATPGAKVSGKWMPNPAVADRPYGEAETFWWRGFADPVLDLLVETACSNNLSLQIAGVRVLEARARLNKSVGSLFPQQQAVSAQAGYSRLNNGLVSRIPGVDPDYQSAQVLFGATWEPDFWGKYRRGIESDRASFLGSLAAYDDALVTLIADVGSTYVNLRTLEERARVAARNAERQRESLRIASAQFKAGATSERDVQQATAQLAQTEAQIPLLEEAMSQARAALALLLGETPDRIGALIGGPGPIPAAPSDIAAGIPRDLLRRRPDVRSAGLAAASKSALIGVARASLYPSFSLSGEFGVSGNNQGGNSLGDMFTWESRTVNAGAGFLFPIFNYGRLVNQVRVQDAQFQQAVLNYQQTVLKAQQEVESALASFEAERRAVRLLEGAVTAARRSTELTMIQYKAGQADYTTVLTAEQAQLAAEDALAGAQGSVALGAVSVYRALGGGWQVREGRDVVSEQVKAEMARRTDWGRLLEPSRHLPAAAAEQDAVGTKGAP